MEEDDSINVIKVQSDPILLNTVHSDISQISDIVNFDDICQLDGNDSIVSDSSDPFSETNTS